MKIAGLQKMTLLDYPGKVACTVFLGGCNFRCTFCHNSQLLGQDAEPVMEESELLTFLEKRRGLLEGVCITGGEPTIQPELAQLLRGIRSLGYPVKLDTNGYRPDVLKNLVAQGLVGYVAMDIKNCPERYAATAGLPAVELTKIEESIRFLASGPVAHEFRTTVAEPLHDLGSIGEMARWLAGLLPGKKLKALYLQPFRDRDTVLFSNLKAPEREDLSEFQRLLQTCAELVAIRGED